MTEFMRLFAGVFTAIAVVVIGAVSIGVFANVATAIQMGDIDVREVWREHKWKVVVGTIGVWVGLSAVIAGLVWIARNVFV